MKKTTVFLMPFSFYFVLRILRSATKRSSKKSKKKAKGTKPFKKTRTFLKIIVSSISLITGIIKEILATCFRVLKALLPRRKKKKKVAA